MSFVRCLIPLSKPGHTLHAGGSHFAMESQKLSQLQMKSVGTQGGLPLMGHIGMKIILS